MRFPDKPVAHLLGSNGPVHAVTYSASPGTYVLTGSADRSIRLYNPFPSANHSGNIVQSSSITGSKKPSPATAVPHGRLIQTYSIHGYEVLSLSVSRDNQRFASAGGDRTVYLWDVATATTLRRFSGAHTARVNAVAMAGDGDSLVVSAGIDSRVHVWDARGPPGKPIQTLDEARDAVSALTVRNAEIVAGSVDGRVRSYDVRVGKVVTDVVAASVTDVCLSRDGRAMLVSSLDSRLRLMDRETGGCLRTFAAVDGDVRRTNEELRVQAVLGGGERWVVAGDELGEEADATAGGAGDAGGAAGGGGARPGAGRVWVWDLLSGSVVARIPVPWGPEGSDGRRRVVVGRDGKERERRNVVSCLAWREDGWGEQFCVGGSSGVVTVFGPSS